MYQFEPKIIAFACNWCSYCAADLAGTSRMQYPANVRIIRVMCSGMVNPMYVLKALEKGTDGVLIAGCHTQDCHYTYGPLKCDVMFEKLKSLAHVLGIEEQRLRREMIAASEGTKFIQVIEDMVDQLKKIGPSPFLLKQRS